jgi:hypothetical protein
MNYRTGFQRLYAVVSVAWIAFIVVIALKELPPPDQKQGDVFDQIDAENHARVIAVDPNDFTSEPPKKAWRDESRANTVIWFTGWAVIPPALGYFLFFGIAPWVYRGFRSQPTNI